MVYEWVRLTNRDIDELKRQYGKMFPEFNMESDKLQRVPDQPFKEVNAQVLQLGESGWFKRTSFPVFLSYSAHGLQRSVTFTIISESDRVYFSELDYCNETTVRDMKRMLQEHGISLGVCQQAKFRERKYPVPKEELEDKVKKLIQKLIDVGKK